MGHIGCMSGLGKDKSFRHIGTRFAPLTAAIRPTVGAAAAVWAHRVDEQGGKIKVSDLSVLGLPPDGCHLAHCGCSGGRLGHIECMRGGGKIKVSDHISTRFAPHMAAIRPTVGAVAAVWGTSSGMRGRGKIKVSDISVLGLPPPYGCHSAHCGCSGGRLGHIECMRGGGRSKFQTYQY